jgi:hypothetical protein
MVFFPSPEKPKGQMEWAHYAIVFAVILVSWIPLMDYWKGDLTPTALSSFAVFVVVDQLAHKYMLGER